MSLVSNLNGPLILKCVAIAVGVGIGIRLGRNLASNVLTRNPVPQQENRIKRNGAILGLKDGALENYLELHGSLLQEVFLSFSFLFLFLFFFFFFFFFFTFDSILIKKKRFLIACMKITFEITQSIISQALIFYFYIMSMLEKILMKIRINFLKIVQ